MAVQLWMCLFSRLGELCLDPRPATRKSAGQTLFSTIAAHGSLLAVPTWQAVLWQVLFPLLDRVGIESGLASTERAGTELLIHHSRNTAAKQWAETQVLTISGVARVFVTKRSLLHSLGDFPKAWRLLLDHVQRLALQQTQEVALAALKAFHEMVVSGGSEAGDSTAGGRWAAAWWAWLAIAQGSSLPLEPGMEDTAAPGQAFLTALFHLYPLLLPHIQTKLVPADLEKLCSVLSACLALPIQTDTELGYLGFSTEPTLLPTHQAMLTSITTTQEFAVSSAPALLPGLFACLPHLAGLVHRWPEPAHRCAVKGVFPEKFILLGERAMAAVGSLYEVTHLLAPVQESGVLLQIIAGLRGPLELRYSCIQQSSWRLASQVLLSCLAHSLTALPACQQRIAEICDAVIDCLDR